MTQDALVIVARYIDPFEAEIARSRLQDEGIRAFKLGGETYGFTGVTALQSTIQIRVAAQDAEKAEQLLARLQKEFDQAKHVSADDPTIYARKVWVCSLCGSANSDRDEECPDCWTPHESIRQSGSRGGAIKRNPDEIRGETPPRTTTDERLREASEGAEAEPAPKRKAKPSSGELELPNLETFLGDDIAERAFYSAVIALLIPPLVLYACWQLWKLSSYDGKLSPRGKRFMFAALGLTCLFFVGWWLLFGVISENVG